MCSGLQRGEVAAASCQQHCVGARRLLVKNRAATGQRQPGNRALNERNERPLKKKEEELKSTEQSKSDIGWGHQIRSYILHPYRLVKDNRTNFESSNPDKILDGEIDDFLESSLFKIND